MTELEEIPIEAEDIPAIAKEINADIPEIGKIFSRIFQKKDEAGQPGLRINRNRSQLPNKNLKQSKRSK